MHNYDELLRGLGHFTHRYGKLHHLDSHNEYWLETESRLRTDFNIQGIKLDQIDTIKRKSEMKQVFLKVGLHPARGRVCYTEKDLRDFVREVGYPIVAKPDIGVGAAETFKLDNFTELEQYLRKMPKEYIAEEFIPGQIITYDGLADANGNLIFSSSLRYSKGVMDVVNEDTDIYYYAVRNIESSLEMAGLITLRAFDVRARFFHFEFFLTESGEAIPLEVNIRPPGGLTLNMFNYVFDFDCYKTWAQMIVNGISKPQRHRPYFVMYIGRKNHIPYAMPHQKVLDDFGSLIVHHEQINSIFARAIGNYGYILRHPELPPLIEAAEKIQTRR
jgi:biotin carboxylase